jgi:periplasmic protein CpxP/Spy
MSTPEQDPQTPPSSIGRRWFAGLAALGGFGLLAAGAQAHGWRRHGLDDDDGGRRIERRIDRLVRGVGATPPQKERLMAIASAALADLRPLREQQRAARLRGMQLLAAPAIDRAALEQARVAQMQAAEARSRRMVQALADAAEVLTPEQRARAAERLKRRMERRRHA